MIMFKAVTQLCPQLYNNIADGHIKGIGLLVNENQAIEVIVKENHPDNAQPPKVYLFNNRDRVSEYASVLKDGDNWKILVKPDSKLPVTRILVTSLKSKSTKMEIEATLVKDGSNEREPIKLRDYV